MKRENYLSWDEYFMGIAMISAERSKDPNSQVGACIVDENNKIVSMGYNGAPIGYDDDKDMTWEREGDFLDTKYAYVCHSELNAILNSKIPVKGCKLYVTLFPCNECAKAIIQSGITELVYLSDKYDQTPGNIASKKMLDACGVKYKKYESKGKELKLTL
ncbi:MAG: dCMP deaminase family protein [Bacilli bacterium]|nr:dCMP deaminase family protein [Bacilli bacterium]